MAVWGAALFGANAIKEVDGFLGSFHVLGSLGAVVAVLPWVSRASAQVALSRLGMCKMIPIPAVRARPPMGCPAWGRKSSTLLPRDVNSGCRPGFWCHIRDNVGEPQTQAPRPPLPEVEGNTRRARIPEGLFLWVSPVLAKGRGGIASRWEWWVRPKHSPLHPTVVLCALTLDRW